MSTTFQGPIKNVVVTVDGGTTVVCTPSTVNVTAADTLVVFTLNTSGYNFPASNAVVVTTSNSDFPYSSWTAKPTIAGIYDKCGVVGDYEYTCTVVETATGRVLSLDPIIHNGTP